MIQSGFEIPGQDKSLRLLKDIIKSKRIPHAFLFTGPEGVGKHFAAKEFFRYLNAEALKNNSAPELQKILNLNEPYIKFIFPLPRGKSETADDGPYDKLTDNQMAIVKEEFEMNKLLIDLSEIPVDIKTECLTVIAEAVGRKNVPAVDIGVRFMKFAGRWALTKIGNNSAQFMPMLKSKYME